MALAVGRELAKAQEKLARYGDGLFIRWINERLTVSRTTAYKWLRLHEIFGDCPQCVQTIDISALYILSHDSGPAYKQTLADALAITESGERVTRGRVIDLLESRRDEGIHQGWSDEDVPTIPGRPTALEKLKGAWLRANLVDRRKFKEWVQADIKRRGRNHDTKTS